MNPKALLLFLLLGSPAAAQSAQPDKQAATTTSSAAQQFTPADTVRALHNLFKSRRKTGGVLAGGSAAVVALAGVGTALEDNSRACDGYFCPDTFGSILLLTVGTAPAWFTGLNLIGRFSAKQEGLIVNEYETSGRLPRKIRKKLAARFFSADYRFSRPSEKQK